MLLFHQTVKCKEGKMISPSHLAFVKYSCYIIVI